MLDCVLALLRKWKRGGVAQHRSMRSHCKIPPYIDCLSNSMLDCINQMVETKSSNTQAKVKWEYVKQNLFQEHNHQFTYSFFFFTLKAINVFSININTLWRQITKWVYAVFMSAIVFDSDNKANSINHS